MASPIVICAGVHPLDFEDPCVRRVWEALAPSSLVLVIIILSIPKPKPISAALNYLKFPFESFITLKEAEAFDLEGHTEPERVETPLWRTLLLSWVSLFETVAWLAVGGYELVALDDGKNPAAWRVWTPFLVAFSWLYCSIRPLVRPQSTPPYDLFLIYLFHLSCSVIEIGAILYGYSLGIPLGRFAIAATIFNLAAICTLLCVVLAMPLAVPSPQVDKTKVGVEIIPEDYTTLWGWLTFTWVDPLIKKGTTSTLNEGDVWNMSPTIQSRPIFLKFVDVKRASLYRRIWATNSLDLILDFCLTLVSVFFNYASPFFLNRILEAVGDPSPAARSKGYIYALLAFLCSIIKAEADVQHLWFGRRAATRVRSELMASVFDKALKRKDTSGVVDLKESDTKEKPGSSKSQKKDSKKDPKKDRASDIGKIVQLMSSDANRTSNLLSAGYFIYGAPFEIAIACTFLYQLLGLSAFAGFVVLLFASPINHFLSKRNVAINKALSTARDKRMSVLNELISEAKFLKVLSWEEKWTERALDSRAQELKLLVKDRINSVLFTLLWVCAPVLVSIMSFCIFVLQGNELTVPIAFTAIALFNMLKGPLNIIPFFIVQLLQAGVSIDRIAGFLEEEEVPDFVSGLKQCATDLPRTQFLGIEHGSFQWNSTAKPSDAKMPNLKGKKPAEPIVPPTTDVDEETRFELQDISVSFPIGELTVITGPTASGKTALLMALLGEMTPIRPDPIIHLPKNPAQIDEHGLKNAVSYAAQTPWLEHLSIRDNILFGSPYEAERYNEVLECCALKPDLAIFEDGDATEIGARGISLSGGQKARVALARAVYSRTKHVLLDDPLSAVDSHTSRFLLEHLLQGPLMKNRTVVLVTHHVELVLPAAYYIIRMLDGRIDIQGTAKELRENTLLDSIAHDAQQELPADQPFKAAEALISPIEDTPTEKKKARKFVEDEVREVGSVKWGVYKVYLEASSYFAWALILLGIFMYQGVGILEKIWIQVWGESYDIPETNLLKASYLHSSVGLDTHHDHAQAALGSGQSFPLSQIWTSPTITTLFPNAKTHPLFYVAVYASIGLGSALITTLNSIIQYTSAYRASKILFKRLLHSVVRSTMRWHDVTPTGRILNRFSKDIETVDSSLSSSLRATSAWVAGFIASLLVIAVVFPGFLLPAAFIGYAYVSLSIGYLNTGRDLRRMESTTRSPIFSGFGETLEGIVTVRAFSAERRFLDVLHNKIDTTTKMWYNFWMLNRWLLLRFDSLGAASVLVTSLLALSGLIPYEMAGLTITSAMSFTTAVYWTCRFVTTLEMDLNSVERLVEYLDLPQEPPAIIESSRPPAYWPSNNADRFIDVENLVIQYAPELPPVLHEVSFTIKSREKVGLLGRTGSGKSTLAMAFVRFVEPTSGSIILDGINISSIGLHDLRSRVTIIPQDSVLFSGTIRDNLDPFGEHSDEECLNALFRVQLVSESALASRQSSHVQSRAASLHDSASESDVTVQNSIGPTDDSKVSIRLDTQVSVGGSNFSQGQRQLLAMARALLRRTSIAIFDEATSSIDFKTDAKIQATIREEFKDSCVLTVAHRIRTVIDYDRLIILDKGRVIELDTPYNLIQKDGGVFRDMCLKSGTFKELEEAARVASGRMA